MVITLASKRKTWPAHHVFLLSTRKLSAKVAPESISMVALMLVTCKELVLVRDTVLFEAAT